MPPSRGEYDLFTAPMLLGTAFNWALLGVLTAQIYMFKLAFPKERLGIKVLVYGMYFLDLLQTVAATNFAWYMLVAGWGNPEVFVKVPWPGSAQPILTGLISAIAQIYFAWRISVLKQGSKTFIVISIIIVLTALMQLAGALVNGIKIAITADVSEIANLEATVDLWLGGSFAVDIIIALTMIFIFSQARRESISRRTDVLLKRLIVNTVETGAITAVTAGADLILYLANKDNYLHLLPSLLLGKLYTIVVVASLNGRTRLLTYEDTFHSSDFEISADSHRITDVTGPRISVEHGGFVAVHITTDVTTNDTKSVSARHTSSRLSTSSPSSTLPGQEYKSNGR